MKDFKKWAFFHALGVVVYVVIVSTIMRNGGRLFGEHDTWMTPIAILMLFVLSAFVVGGLVIGKPLMLYLDGKKKEAVTMFLNTGLWLAVFAVITLIVAMLVK